MSSQAADTNEQVVTTIRLPRAQHDRLKELAASEHRSISGELRLMIDRHLEATTKPGQVAA